jgi:hypothetical protein
MLSNILNPIVHRIEKKVAAQSIPSVQNIPNRKTLAEAIAAFKDDTTLVTPIDHSLWDALLKAYVHEGGTSGAIDNVSVVDYQGLSKDVRFDQYLKILETASTTQLAHPSENIAFYMNAYNALCIHHILQYEQANNIKITSINQLTTSDQAVWNQPVGILAGERVSLNQIEHERLRGVWKEPTVHACIVCASASCPNLRREAFIASRVQEQMQDQMKVWMQHPTKGFRMTIPEEATANGWFNGLVRQPIQVELSRIFLWFADDFAGNEGGSWNEIRQWLAPYVADEKARAILLNKSTPCSVSYFEYDWTINHASPRK